MFRRKDKPQRAVRSDENHKSKAGVRRQREEFGGINWGAALFGWLVAVGLAAILVAILSAAGAALGLTSVSRRDANKSAATIGIGGGIALLIVLLLGYYCGGYVAGRMSRFDGRSLSSPVRRFALEFIEQRPPSAC